MTDDFDAPASCTALVETTHGLIRWDVRALDDPALPLGSDVLSATELGMLRRLAWLTWAEAWWPAGRRVAPLSLAILHGEIAVATAAASHLLDDDEAVERSLDDAVAVHAATALQALAQHEPLAPAASALLAQLQTLAEDFGVPLEPAEATAAPQADWALAAGAAHPSTDPPLVTGRSALRWADLPPGVLAADADIEWRIDHAEHGLQLRASVAASPLVDFPLTEPRRRAQLIACYGPPSLELHAPMARDGDRYRAEIPLTAPAMLLPPSEREVRVRDVRYGRPDAVGPGSGADEAANDLMALAGSRLRRALAHPADTELSLAERAAALGATVQRGGLP